MPTPKLPAAREALRAGAKVIDQRPGPNATVLVTFALPGLRRATVTVSEREWTEGNHLPIGAHLARMLTPSGYNNGDQPRTTHR
jgi:hypothetical protein